ncbi:MAG: NADH-quinone oxidoreductase subunit C [Candidatus Aenigmarchaeota archaeon]|nr:NADH-quinone oxidoreductase subunit C [Candidatus Aenigmarchaeota archaeon]
MNANDVRDSFKRRFAGRIMAARTEIIKHKLKQVRHASRVWITVDSGELKNAVRHLCKITEHPHFIVISGYEKGKYLELTYHFSLNYASVMEEVVLSIKVRVSKENPVLPTITDLIPGALISEREMQEMLGVRIKGIPDSRRIFLHPGFPQGVYPWRRDETGPARLVRNLHKGGGR